MISWNSCYYMSKESLEFEAHASEMLRVVKPGGWLDRFGPRFDLLRLQIVRGSGQWLMP